MPEKTILEESKINSIIERNQNGESIRSLCKEFEISRTVLRNELSRIGYIPKVNSHPSKITVPKKDLENYIARYNNGESLTTISNSTPFTSCTLARKFRENGIELRPRYPELSTNEIESIVNRYQDGETVTEISFDLKHSQDFISDTLRKAGVKLRSRPEFLILAHQKDGNNYKRKYPIDESAFETVAEESAYWAGFLMADGCVHSSNVSLTLQHRDLSHIEKFRDFLKSSHKISTISVKSPSSDKFYPQATYTFSSAKIVNSLKIFGITPRKSLTAKVKGLENNRHFWRGVIDGDGSLGLDKRGNTAYISLVGSQYLMKQFLSFVKSIVDTKAKVNQHHSIFAVGLACQKAFDVISVLYNDCNIYLDRKYKSFQEISKRRAEISQNQGELNELTLKIGQLYLQGVSGVKISKETGASKSAVYEHLKRYEKITGEKVPRRFKTRQLPTGKRYRLDGKCKNCGKETVPNRSKCEFHLAQARNWWREKHGQNLAYKADLPLNN